MLTPYDFDSDYEQYTNVPDSLVDELCRAANDLGYRGSGKGGYYNRMQTVMACTDRFGINVADLNTENIGLTFITKPKLNLTMSNIRHEPILSTLVTDDPTTVPFAIRCYLDSNYATLGNSGLVATNSFYYDSRTPYINPLTNSISQIHGWPPFDVSTVTSEDGFFGENQTMAKGSDFNNQTYDLTLTFRDTTGSPALFLIHYWVYWIACMMQGSVTKYEEDIIQNRHSYTCAIYRFVLDASKTRITAWSKATGCFPRSSPINEKFDIASRSHFIDSLHEFSVQFVANHISYMNPNTLLEFNSIVTKFAGPIFDSRGSKLRSDLAVLPNVASNNYKGFPYIDTWRPHHPLYWLGDRNEQEDTISNTMSTLRSSIAAYTARLEAADAEEDNESSGYIDYDEYSSSSFV